MFWSFGAPKGGVGTSVVVAAVARQLSRDRDVVIVDLAGDQADLLGADHAGPGLRDWLGAEATVDEDALCRLAVEIGPRLRLVPAGSAASRWGDVADRVACAVDGFRRRDVIVVADVGVLGCDAADPAVLFATAGDRTSLVVRACYLALKRATRLSVRPDDVVEIVEPGRALGTIDIETVVELPVTARVGVDPAVARAADAGLLLSRPPRALRRLGNDLIAAARLS